MFPVKQLDVNDITPPNVSLSDRICPLTVAECKPGLSDPPQTGSYGDIMGSVQVQGPVCAYYGDQRQAGSLPGY